MNVIQLPGWKPRRRGGAKGVIGRIILEIQPDGSAIVRVSGLYSRMTARAISDLAELIHQLSLHITP